MANEDLYSAMLERKRKPRSPLEDLARIGQTMGAAYGGYALPKFEEPEEKSALESLLERAEAADAAKTLGDPQLYHAIRGTTVPRTAAPVARSMSPFNQVTGGQTPGLPMMGPLSVDDFGELDEVGKAQVAIAQTQAEKNMLSRKEQMDIERDELQQQQSDEALREDVRKNLESIRRVKEGEKYFGRFGWLPTLATPQVFSEEEYGKRQQWENEVNRLLSQKVIDVMNKMKRVSKTGATGFGQLSNKELQLLREASTALSRHLPGEIAMEYLNEMEKVHTKFLTPTEESGVGMGVNSEVDDPLGIL